MDRVGNPRKEYILYSCSQTEYFRGTASIVTKRVKHLLKDFIVHNLIMLTFKKEILQL